MDVEAAEEEDAAEEAAATAAAEEEATKHKTNLLQTSCHQASLNIGHQHKNRSPSVPMPTQAAHAAHTAACADMAIRSAATNAMM